MRLTARRVLWALCGAACLIALVAAAAAGFASPRPKRQAAKGNRPARPGWQTFAPPGKGFTVELPRAPRHTRSAGGGKDIPFKCTAAVDSYVIPLRPGKPELAFVLAVYDVGGCARREEDFTSEVEGFVGTIGGDNKEFITDRHVTRDGFAGREYSFTVEDYHNRGLIIRAGKRIFVLMYATDVAGELSSPEVNRMFETFHVVKP